MQYRDPFGFIRLFGDLLRSTSNAKAFLFAILAFLLQSIIGFGPLAYGIWLLLEGEVWRAIWQTAILYLAIGFYMALWPVLALLMFITIWVQSGLSTALITTVLVNGIALLLLAGPEWLMVRAHQAAARAEFYSTFDTTLESSHVTATPEHPQPSELRTSPSIEPSIELSPPGSSEASPSGSTQPTGALPLQLQERAIKRCPYCAEEIDAVAIKCRHCGEWLVPRTGGGEARPPFANVQPRWQLMLLSTLTLGIYGIYWFYRNWKQLSVASNIKIRPGWRTLALAVPILGVYYVYDQFRTIRNTAVAEGISAFKSPGWLWAGYVIFTGLSWRILGPYSGEGSVAESMNILGLSIVFNLIATLLLSVVQQTLNSYWIKVQSGLRVRTGLNFWEIVLSILSLATMTLVIAGFYAEP